MGSCVTFNRNSVGFSWGVWGATPGFSGESGIGMVWGDVRSQEAFAQIATPEH